MTTLRRAGPDHRASAGARARAIGMKVLFVCRSEDHASSRVRPLQYVGPLEALGHEVRVLSLGARVDRRRRRPHRGGRAARWADVV